MAPSTLERYSVIVAGSAPHKIKHFVLQYGIFYLFALLIAFGLKYHYSRAGSDDLLWILRPTAGLVEYLSGIKFENEANTGFVSQGYQIIIAPSCAGINFLIVAFCMAVFAGLHVIKHCWLKHLWLAASLACAYILTVAVNSLRIIAAIYSYNAAIYFSWITPERVHRLEGIVIYFFFLCLFYMIIIRTVQRNRQGAVRKPISAIRHYCAENDYIRWACSGLIPLFWYGLITLGVPVFSGAFQENSSRFKEHSWTVILASVAVLVVIFLIQLGGQRIMGMIVNRGYPLRGPKR